MVSYTAMTDLPIISCRDEILSALGKNRVLIVCGDTGSGKTTQLPQMLLENGYGVKGRRIACTQPRRLAALAMATRVAAERHVALGDEVGFQHRFGRAITANTRLSFMTDGILLAETRTDPLLKRYDAIIIDEAHERSLNIDFLLGILKRILARRRDLKIIISSATLDASHFAAYFGDAPVLDVPGRRFPIDISYRPPAEADERDLPHEIADALLTLPAHDDVLVFLAGERDIRETAARLDEDFPQDEIIPLLASLPAAEQQRAFRLSSRRRVVLATNVAETSLTIPGIRHVIDTGLARISRYIPRTRVQRLQIEPVSQASARQRAGRCGRLGPGRCIRLYSEEDLLAREAQTPPEVLRASLAGVILAMLDLKLGDIAQFPFLDPPKPARIREGLRELLELGAVKEGADAEPVLTPIGRKLACIPVEPRLARILLAASENGSLREMLPIVAALGCDDPRRRPIDEKEKADQAHAAWRVKGSDFLGIRALWQWHAQEIAPLSQTKARAACKKKYLSFPKMREWRETAHQLERLCRQLKLSFAEPAERDETQTAIALHRALLTGFLGRIGHFDTEKRDYRGAYGLRFALHPSSVLAKKTKAPPQAALPVNAHRPVVPPKTSAPAWIMAGELTETTRLFAHHAAEIDPRWIEPAAGDLCRHSYREPFWDAQSGFVRATEQVTLHGIVIVPSRRCDFSRIDRAQARRIFIRFALVEGAWPNPPKPVDETLSRIREMREKAARTRQSSRLDDERLFDHFDGLLPADMASTRDLRRWLHAASPAQRAAFLLEGFAPGEDEADDADFPKTIRLGSATLHLTYRHTPDNPDTDGITCSVQRKDAAALKLWHAQWLVPGALPEKIAWHIQTLPKAVRRALPQTDDMLATLLACLKPGSENFRDALRKAIDAQWGIAVSREAWDHLAEPVHFSVRYRVLDGTRPVAISRNLDAVLTVAGVETGQGVTAEGLLPPAPAAREAQTEKSIWTFGALDGSRFAQGALAAHPALHDETTRVSVRLYPDAETAARVHDAGVARLFRLALEKSARPDVRKEPFARAFFLKRIGYAPERLAEDILHGAVKETFVRGQPAIRDARAFGERLEQKRPFLNQARDEAARLVHGILDQAAELADLLERADAPGETCAALNTQLSWLVFPGFAALVPHAQLRHYARYLKGAFTRLSRARNNPSLDREKEARFAPYWRRYRDVATDGTRRTACDAEKMEAYRWLAEEYRISVFAQELRTAVPVSPKRLDALWREALRLDA